MKTLESSYDSILNLVFGALNPVKRSVINTHCNVHKFINILALTILANDGFEREYNFRQLYRGYQQRCGMGDQDFKHSPFLSPYMKKGLYGRKKRWIWQISITQCSHFWDEGDNKSAFFFGAVLHHTYMTIPAC